MGKKIKVLDVKGTLVSVIAQGNNDYVCLTDMAKASENDARSADIIKNWIRNRSTLEFLGTWEELYNPDFKVVEFDHFKAKAGLHTFVLSPSQWVEKTNAIGIFSKKGRYGGTYAHKDIAFEFGSAISPVFKLYLIKEFQRLKDEENDRLKLNWNLHRTLSKVNYRIHTDAIKEKLIPSVLEKNQISFVYATEADLLNVALYGLTASKWRSENPEKGGNIRDYSSLEQLLVLANLESINAELIRMGWTQGKRIIKLNEVARTQMKSVLKMSSSIKKLE